MRCVHSSVQGVVQHRPTRFCFMIYIVSKIERHARYTERGVNFKFKTHKHERCTFYKQLFSSALGISASSPAKLIVSQFPVPVSRAPASPTEPTAHSARSPREELREGLWCPPARQPTSGCSGDGPLRSLRAPEVADRRTSRGWQGGTRRCCKQGRSHSRACKAALTQRWRRRRRAGPASPPYHPAAARAGREAPGAVT